MIELLVVISVIVILVSLLLPALNKATGAARNITCINLLKQQGNYFTFYSNDNENAVVPSRLMYPDDTDVWWHRLMREYNYAFFTRTGKSATGAPKQASAPPVCPSAYAENKQVTSGGNTFDLWEGSFGYYGANYTMSGVCGYINLKNPGSQDQSYRYKKLNQVKSPTHKLYLFDGYCLIILPYPARFSSLPPDESFLAWRRHDPVQLGVNALFIDGHAGKVKYENPNAAKGGTTVYKYYIDLLNEL